MCSACSSTPCSHDTLRGQLLADFALVNARCAPVQIDEYVRLRGGAPRFVKGYRVTDELAMEAAMEAAGFNRVLFEALLSKVQPFTAHARLRL